MQDGGLSRRRLPDDLTEIGLSEEEVSNFGGESEIGQHLLLIRHDGRKQETINILCSSGASEYFGVTITLEPDMIN